MEALQDRMAAFLAALREKSKSSTQWEATQAPSQQQPLAKKIYQCERCKDEGGFIVTKQAGETITIRDVDGTFKEIKLKHPQDQWKDCECAKLRKLNRLIKSSEITAEFQKMGFSNFDETKVHPQIAQMKQVAMHYYKVFEQIRKTRINSCLFIGQPGCGKTHLLTAISNNLMHKRYVPVLYFPYRDGMSNISENNFEKKNTIMDHMKNVDVLFIDDLFKPIGNKPNIKDWMVEILYEVINHRYLNNKPILVSTELPLQSIVDIDEALASRIFEMASDFTVTIDRDLQNNYRLRKLQGGA